MNRQINKIWLTCLVMFIAILMVTFIAFSVTRMTVSRELDTRVNKYADNTEDLIEDELRSSEGFLRSCVGLLNSYDGEMSQEVWIDFMKQSNANNRFDGVLGFGYTDVLPTNERQVYEAENNIDIYPDESDNEKLAPIIYLYTEDKESSEALGFDKYTSDTRREAMLASRDSNDATLTTPTELVVSKDVGFVMYVPRYRKSADISDIEKKRENIVGYVYAVFNSGVFLEDALERQSNDNYTYQIYAKDRNTLLFEEKGFMDESPEDKSETIVSSEIFGLEFDTVYQYSDGSVLPGSIRTQPTSVMLIGVIGATLAAFLTWLLLSNRNNELLLEKERDINEAKDNLLSIASHQLRTPATGVKQYVGMILHGMAGDISDTQQNFLEKAYESNERQLKTINDILYLARLESGRIVLTETKILIRSVVQSLVEEMKESIDENNHKITVEVPKRPIYIWADEHMVRMIIENILSNAIKYTPEKGKIKICLKKVKDGVSFRVTDSGVGIKDQDKEEIFKQFSRAGNSLSKSVSGSGVGLYLVKNLVELHNGEITVESDGKSGSTFTLYLPTNKPTKSR